MPLLTADDIKRAKLLVEAHAELVAQYKARSVETGELDPQDKGFLNINGHEVLSDEVMEPPLGYLDQPDLMETIRRMIRSEELHRAHRESETFEEADDFDVDDDFDPGSPYEMFFDPQPGAATGPSGLATSAPTDLGDTPPAPSTAPQSDTGGQAGPSGSSSAERGGGGAERPPSGS